jgi:uncharacterized protein YndB with AHSA1/START domain
LKKFLVGLAVVVVLFFGIGYLLPSDYRAERSLVIDAPAEKIFPLLNDLSQWHRWAVWFARDPGLEINRSDPPRGVGAFQKWNGEQGRGELTITESENNRRLVYSLFFPEFGARTTGSFQLIPGNEGTRVVWANEGNAGDLVISGYFALFMDSMMGPDLLGGLRNLKRTVEAEG